MKWFRVYSEIKDDPKLLELNDHQRWLWICLLAMASETKTRGVITGIRLRGLAATLRTDAKRLQAALTAFVDADMIAFDQAAGTLEVRHWNERQYDKPSDTPTSTRERKQRSRQSHADVTPGHATDTDTDTDTDSDSEAEERIKSNTTTPLPPSLDTEFARVCDAYHSNIGMLTPMLSDKLKDDLATFGAEWLVEAIEISVRMEKRSLFYVEAILKRWKQEGHGTNGNGAKPAATAGRYVEKLDPATGERYMQVVV